MIEWSAVEVDYGKARVLGPVTVRVASGEWLALIGPNGAGKSTMLKAGAGLVPHRGTIRVGKGARRPGHDVAWMPQRPTLPPEMGVYDYVMLGRTPHLGFLAGEGRSDHDSVGRALALLGLDRMAHRPLGTLSGGEAQRAQLARALSQEAPVLLLDEPTASLDIGHAVEVLEAIDGLRLSRELTVVTAVHDLTLAGRFADRLVLLGSGLTAAHGAPSEVLTEELLSAHYGAGIRVLDDPSGPTVVPTRSRDARAEPAAH